MIISNDQNCLNKKNPVEYIVPGGPNKNSRLIGCMGIKSGQQFSIDETLEKKQIKGKKKMVLN